MFKRPETTYDCDDSVLDGMLADEANPLLRIVELVPSGSRVFDIGAGNGMLGRLFAHRGKQVEMDGLEPNEYAARAAEPHYQKFYTGHFEKCSKEIELAAYDYIILADVIEHIEDPLEFLSGVAGRMGDETRLVLTVPNVAFGAVRIALLNGDFNYCDSGLLERTHIRFFTLQTLLSMVRELGLGVDKLYHLKRDMMRSEISLENYQHRPLDRILEDELASTYQFLLVAGKGERKTETVSFGAASCAPRRRSLLRRVLHRLKRGVGRA